MNKICVGNKNDFSNSPRNSSSYEDSSLIILSRLGSKDYESDAFESSRSSLSKENSFRACLRKSEHAVFLVQKNTALAPMNISVYDICD